MSLQLAEEQLNNISDIQVEMYDVRNEEGKESQELFSPFYQVFEKSTWHTVIKNKMDNNASRGGNSFDNFEVTYTVNNNFHYLLRTRMSYILPSVTIKEEHVDKVRICWSHNVGINIMVSASFYENDNRYTTIDPVWIDDYFAWYQQPGSGKRKAANIGIGKMNVLEDWTTPDNPYLPNYDIDWAQPWFYSEHTYTAFPIFYLGKNCRAEHRYTFRNLRDLLRIQILQNGEWIDLPDRRQIENLVTFSSSTHVVPEIWADYAYITQAERVWAKTECHGKHEGHSYYIHDIESFDCPNPSSSGSTTESKLSCNNPALAMFWKAENELSTANHNFSNYTANEQQVYHGWDPIKSSTLTTDGKNKIFEKIPSHHVNIGVMEHFLSAPAEPGYHAYSFTHNTKDYNLDITLHLGKLNAVLHCTLGNTDIYDNLLTNNSTKEIFSEKWDSSNSSFSSSNRSLTRKFNKPSYYMRVRVLVCRKFSINKGKDGNFNFTIM